MTVQDIQNDLIEFNKKLDQLEKAYNIPPRVEVANDEQILANSHVDGMISFETKVMYFNNYFEQKYQEITTANQ